MNPATDGAEEICAGCFSIALSGKNNPVIAIGKISHSRVFKLKIPSMSEMAVPITAKDWARSTVACMV